MNSNSYHLANTISTNKEIAWDWLSMNEELDDLGLKLLDAKKEALKALSEDHESHQALESEKINRLAAMEAKTALQRQLYEQAC